MGRFQIAAYSRDNRWVASQVLGVFPAQSLNTLLTVEEVQAAMERHAREDGDNVVYALSDRRLVSPSRSVKA